MADLDDEALLDIADLLIFALDALEGDADFEPSLGSVTSDGVRCQRSDQRYWSEGLMDDREEQCEGEGEPENNCCNWPDEDDQSDVWQARRPNSTSLA